MLIAQVVEAYGEQPAAAVAIDGDLVVVPGQT
jgi:hypothetical protein